MPISSVGVTCTASKGSAAATTTLGCGAAATANGASAETGASILITVDGAGNGVVSYANGTTERIVGYTIVGG